MQDFNQNPIFNKAEVQQLRKILSEEIARFEERAEILKYNARYFKFNKETASLYWKDHFKVRAKIKKLAALQMKLKSHDVLY